MASLPRQPSKYIIPTESILAELELDIEKLLDDPDHGLDRETYNDIDSFNNYIDGVVDISTDLSEEQLRGYLDINLDIWDKLEYLLHMGNEEVTKKLNIAYENFKSTPSIRAMYSKDIQELIELSYHTTSR